MADPVTSTPSPAHQKKKRVLLIGGGSVGTIAALNLEKGGMAEVGMVLRGNYQSVKEKGYWIESCDFGELCGFRPTDVLNAVPDIKKEGLEPYDYIVLATKNTPDIPPSLTELVAPALPPDNTHTTLVLIQNGLNIEKPFQAAFPNIIVLSGVSLIGSAEPEPGHIVQDDSDRLLIAPFPLSESSPTLEARAQALAQDFVTIYAASGKTTCTHSPAVLRDRWRKLVYNATLNPICALTGLDTGRLRLAPGLRAGLVEPAMREVISAARACGVELASEAEGEDEIVRKTVEMDPLEIYLAPSMLADVRKGNYVEVENLVGEVVRAGREAGVEMRVLGSVYELVKAIQWRTMEARGLVGVPKSKGDSGDGA